MTHYSFEHLRTQRIDSLNLDISEYRHVATGARHFHLASEDNNNAFLVAFLTVPQDSTGVAHILEHTSLCGSEHYPVRDPFFMMTRRSLNTFMNAFTSSDWTAYPFASQNPKDFDNLLQVYLDAVFFPRLDQLDFSQEGHRVEFEKADDPQSDLVFKGVVFNEMKGAMSSPVSTLWHLMHENIFSDTTYHYNSGGEPADIPNLTYEGLKAFHARHYHPSNAMFMTYGDLPVETHQARFHDLALSKFDKEELDLAVPDETRFQSPRQVDAPYALDGEEELNGKTHIVIGWLLGKGADLQGILRSHLLSSVLLDNSASPLRYALETTSLGTSPSELCGLDDSTREATFMCGVEGSDPEHADAVEKMVLDVISDVAENGVPQDMLDSVLHQLELGQSEIKGGSFPYGLRLMVNVLTPTLHGGDPVEMLNLESALEVLRNDIKDPGFIKMLAKELLENPHRLRLVMHPDPELSTRMMDIEKKRLQEMKNGLSDKDKDNIIQLAKILEERQNLQENPEVLPKVTLEDVPEEIYVAKGSNDTLADIPVTVFEQGTNGLVYARIVVDLPSMSEEEQDLLPLYSDCLTEMGAGDQGYLSMQTAQSAVTGGIGAGCSYRSKIDDLQTGRGIFTLSSKALVRNAGAMAGLMKAVFDEGRFDEVERLRELFAQMRAQQEMSVTGHGHALAMTAASSGMSAAASLTHRWSGLASIKKLKLLDDSLSDEASLQKLSEHFKSIHAAIKNAPRQILLICEGHRRELIEAEITQALQGMSIPDGSDTFAPQAINKVVKEGWAVNTQVNFCAKAYPAVPVQHPDAAALNVLGRFLTNGFLHRAVREQGGAYGGGASYDGDAGAFRFYSYRDPRIEGTLKDFDDSIEWLASEAHEYRELEEAILGVVSAIDRPDSPAGEAAKTFFGDLHGRTAEHRKKYRQQVLNVTMDDLKRVGQTYLKPELASIAVVSDSATLEALDDGLGLQIIKL